MDKIIKEIEDMSLNAWPSHKMELYDGWILRFSYFYTHRTNSVEQFGTSALLYLLILIMFLKTVDTKYNIPPM